MVLLLQQVIDFWDRWPCESGGSTYEAETYEYFEQITKNRYDAIPHVAEFAQFERWAGKKVLEIGVYRHRRRPLCPCGRHSDSS